MKVYILTDMEGISLVFDWDQVNFGSPSYERYREILTLEVNAAVEGALAAGAETVVVCDGHGSNARDYNLLWEKLHPAAELERPASSDNILGSLDESFHSMLMVGYHAMEGTKRAVLSHTQSPGRWHSWKVNGRMMGEIGQMSLLAGGFGVPVAYISGDLAAVREAQSIHGADLPHTVVKEAFESGKARSLHPLESARRIRKDTEDALRQPRRTPFVLPGPYRLELEFVRKDQADDAMSANEELERLNDRTVAKTVSSVQNILQF